jgi:hypothetical protein
MPWRSTAYEIVDTKLQSILTPAKCYDLIPSRKKTPISVNEMLAGPHRLSAYFGEEKCPLILPQILLWSLRRHATSLVGIQNKLTLACNDVVNL